MANELVKQESSFMLLRREAEEISKSGVVRMAPDAIVAILLQARAMDIPPEKALNGLFYFVNGKVGMSSEFMAYLVRKAGHSVIKDSSSTDTKCILHGKRRDNGDTWTVSFSIEDAKRAGLYKEGNPWAKYPSTMCYNRAMSILFRQLFPDLSQGAGYTKDELEEIKDSPMKEVEAVVVEQKISAEQHQNIVDLIGDDTEFQKTLLKRVETAFGANSFYSLPLSQYDNIVRIVKKHNEDRLKKEMEIVASE